MIFCTYTKAPLGAFVVLGNPNGWFSPADRVVRMIDEQLELSWVGSSCGEVARTGNCSVRDQLR